MLPVGLAKERYLEDLEDLMERSVLHLANCKVRLFSKELPPPHSSFKIQLFRLFVYCVL